ncbi:hypothetical protein EW026_g413 [Hermanssonia centrifuga]|uniref:Cyanovirin-N domain-containing protein n=1 Tax=Hermanssonia centrifuga TaxID=98765 RepID=A0A4S4KUN6_9APHY|nr:hypothetical protein EW026_g413 [Hermanssonia centrifuga]
MDSVVSKLSEAKNIRIELQDSGCVLHADIKLADGTFKPAEYPLDMVLGNLNGHFTWGFKGFSKSARNVSINGTVLTAELRAEDESWKSDSFDLNGRIVIGGQELFATGVPCVLAVPKEAEAAALQSLSDTLDRRPELGLVGMKQPDGSYMWALKPNVIDTEAMAAAGVALAPSGAAAAADSEFDFDHRAEVSTGSNPNGTTGGHVVIGVGVKGESYLDDGAIFFTAEGEATASAIHVAKTKGRPIEQVEVDILEAGASASAEAFGTKYFPIPLLKYAGAEAHVNLLKAKASVFDLSLGLGVDTDVGVKDGSVGLHLAGCGITVGRKLSISAFGTGIGIDFGRFFG